MNTLYLDCFSGIAGDMFVGACLDVGVDVKVLSAETDKLGLSGYHLQARRLTRHGLRGTDFRIIVPKNHSHPSRTYHDIQKIIQRSRLKGTVKATALTILDTLATAEAKIHGTKKAKVHFHEIGALDSIVDIVAAAICHEALGQPQVICSPLPMARGFVATEHGRYPLPPPAVVEILNDTPVVEESEPREWVTPTGAAIVKTLAQEFCGLTLANGFGKVGYGFGDYDSRHRPDALRVFLITDPTSYSSDVVSVIETNIDDMNPQMYEPLVEDLLSQGVLDVVLIPVIMKKSRPGILLQVLGSPVHEKKIITTILEQTTTLGVRVRRETRRILVRQHKTIQTVLGPCRVKEAQIGKTGRKFIAEFEDIKKLARRHQLPIRHVHSLIYKNLSKEPL